MNNKSKAIIKIIALKMFQSIIMKLKIIKNQSHSTNNKIQLKKTYSKRKFRLIKRANAQ